MHQTEPLSMRVLLSQCVNSLSLRNKDGAWSSAIHESAFLKLLFWLTSIRALIQAKSIKRVGSALQSLAFILLLVLCCALGLRQFANDKWGLAIISLCSFSLWMGGYLIGGKENRQNTALDGLVLLFLGVNVVSTFASHYFQASFVGLAKTFVYVCSYFSFSAILDRSPKRQAIAISALVFVGLLVAIYGLYQYKIGVAPLATWEDPTIEQKGVRIFSTLGNPNLLAGYLVPLAPLACALGLMAAGMRRWLVALTAFGSTAVLCVAIILTGSRGGWLGLLGSAAAMLYLIVSRLWVYQPHWRKVIIPLLVLLVAVVPIALHFIPTFEHRVQSIFVGYEHSSNAFRLNVWKASFKMFLDNWWFGIGPGNQAFILAYGLYMKTGFDALGTYCVPLEIAVETGIFGLACFGALVLAALARGHKPFWQEQAQTKRWLIAGTVAALVGMMVHGLVDTVFYRPQVQFIFWLIIAILASDVDPKT